ncbi:hypothetical protein ACHAXR_011304 [Thalassiosira sp. AJA248-18]
MRVVLSLLFFVVCVWTALSAMNEICITTLSPPESSVAVVSGGESKSILAICAPTRSVSNWETLADTSLQILLIPSIERTITKQEFDEWDVRLYLGIDDNDAFLRNHSEALNSTWLTIYPRFYEAHEDRAPFNEMMRDAYEDGAEYMVRVNDDTEFVTLGWITHGVQTLLGFEPPNVGVVGPTCKQGNTKIMTHDMVHRSHLEIFGEYYPIQVYKPTQSIQLTQWEVHHHVTKHGTRYKRDREQQKYLELELEKGKTQLSSYVGRLNSSTAS